MTALPGAPADPDRGPIALPADDPVDLDPDLDAVEAVVIHLRSRGRKLRLDEHGRYEDPQCPVSYRHAVTVADPSTGALIFRCSDERCDRASVLRRYGLDELADQAAGDQIPARVEARFHELVIEHLAQERFTGWLAQRGRYEP
jgi:hypothetical protein